MRDAYRNELDAALQQVESLRRENAELRQKLLEPETDVPPAARVARPMPAHRLTFMLMVIGCFVGALAVVTGIRASSSSPPTASTPCPFERSFDHATPFEPVGYWHASRLHVVVQPAEAVAEIRVDDTLVVSGRGEIGLDVDNRAAHRVTVHAPGYAPVEGVVYPFPGASHEVSIALLPLTVNDFDSHSMRNPFAR